jgi:hypothetical protein
MKMPLDHFNAGVVGQVDPTTFVHRLFQDSHVRFRLTAKFEGDNHVANVVDYRLITGSGVADVEHKCEVFGTSMFEYDKARAVFTAWVGNYIGHMELPK